MELIDVTRKSFAAKAVRVTEENMQAVAEWCGGYVSSTRAIDPGDRHFVYVPYKRSVNSKWIPAFPGNWVTLAHNRFSVHRNSVFLGTFDRPGKKVPTKSQIEAFVKQSMTKWLDDGTEGTAESYNSIAAETAQKIVELFGGTE